jgi:hypothetical protein
MPGGYSQDSLEQVRKRTEKCRNVLQFFINDTNVVNCYHVRLDPKENDPKILGSHWAMSVSASEDRNEAMSNILGGKEFPELSLVRPLFIFSARAPVLPKYRAYPPLKATPRAWAAPRLIAAELGLPGTQQKLANKTWMLSVPVNEANEKLVLQLVFDQPLALLKDWPSIQNWEN